MLSLFVETQNFAVVTENSIILNFLIGKLHCTLYHKMVAIGSMRSIIIQDFFLCPGYQSTERDDLKFILKFIFKYHCVLFIHFPPKYVYLFKMLLTLYYDGKGDIKIYFWGNKSWYLPNVLGINNCLLCRTTGVNYISYNVFQLF